MLSSPPPPPPPNPRCIAAPVKIPVIVLSVTVHGDPSLFNATLYIEMFEKTLTTPATVTLKITYLAKRSGILRFFPTTPTTTPIPTLTPTCYTNAFSYFIFSILVETFVLVVTLTYSTAANIPLEANLTAEVTNAFNSSEASIAAALNITISAYTIDYTDVAAATTTAGPLFPTSSTSTGASIEGNVQGNKGTYYGLLSLSFFKLDHKVIFSFLCAISKIVLD